MVGFHQRLGDTYTLRVTLNLTGPNVKLLSNLKLRDTLVLTKLTNCFCQICEMEGVLSNYLENIDALALN